MATSKKPNRDFPLAPTPKESPVSNSELTPQNTGGTYVAYNNGRVGRFYGKSGPYESMDTTGYSNGKKEFEIAKSYSTGETNRNKISRKDVPTKIQEFKKGATRFDVEKPLRKKS